jgi:hypothetical protein
MVLANEFTEVFKILTNVEAEVRLQSLADNLPGVVFQYLIYTDGTDNLKYVTKDKGGVGFSAEEVLQNLQLVWDGIAAVAKWKTLKKSIAECVEAKTKWTAQIYNAKR